MGLVPVFMFLVFVAFLLGAWGLLHLWVGKGSRWVTTLGRWVSFVPFTVVGIGFFYLLGVYAGGIYGGNQNSKLADPSLIFYLFAAWSVLSIPGILFRMCVTPGTRNWTRVIRSWMKSEGLISLGVAVLVGFGTGFGVSYK